MLQERIRRQQQAIRLEQIVAAMPQYPIYHEVNGDYSIYIANQHYVFASDEAARIAQLKARVEWLRAHNDGTLPVADV